MKKEDGIAMTEGVLPRISKDEIEWARLTSEYKYVVDTQSKVVQARREGREEGRLEGRREGKEEGIFTVLELIKAGYSLEAIQERFRADKNFSGEKH
jgi:predicted transposase YdaD